MAEDSDTNGYEIDFIGLRNTLTVPRDADVAHLGELEHLVGTATVRLRVTSSKGLAFQRERGRSCASAPTQETTTG